ncbi:dipeptidase [Acetobacteraceae bacterium H6797]|nr:dipeptidase [Acetobacteraceae bacterium H6797]
MMAVHGATLCLDTHVDIPWPNTPDPHSRTSRQVDYPKMRAGGLNAVVFIAYTQQGKRDEAGHAAAGAKAEAMLRAIAATAGRDGTRLVTNADELEAAFAAKELAVMLGVENGYAMGHDLSRLKLWRDLGACYVTVTHDGHNDLADAARFKPDLGDAPTCHGGLSELGRQAVREMNRVGLMVDASHTSKSSMMQAAELSRAPIVVTHTCCKTLCDHPRNIDDEQMDMLRQVGGLMQITAVPAFVRAPEAPGQRSQATVKDIADHVDYAVNRIGLDHVGLSSDFDGGGGVEGWKDASETANLSLELLRRGYSARELGLLWSGNFMRLMRITQRLAD